MNLLWPKILYARHVHGEVAFERRLAGVSQKLYGKVMFFFGGSQKQAFQTFIRHAFCSHSMFANLLSNVWS